MGIKIEAVLTKKDLKEFILFPWQVYKKDPFWVPPLISDVKSLHDLKRNSFWEHAEQMLFLARKDGKAVGRIAGIIDRNYIDFYNEQVGFFGFFETFNDYEIAELLLDQVRAWLIEKGIEIMRGPMNPSTKESFSLLVQGFDSSPVVNLTYNPKYYVDFMEKYGMQKARDYYAYTAPVPPETPAPILRAAKHAKEMLPELVIRPINMKRVKEEKENIKRLMNSNIFEEHWGYVPVTDKEFDFFAERLRRFAIPELLLFAELKGEPIGFIIYLPDYNQPLKKINGCLFPFGWLKYLYYARKIEVVRLIYIGVLKEYRLKGIEALLIHESSQKAYELGYRKTEVSKILEENYRARRAAEAYGGKIYKTYRVYELKT